MQLALVLFLLSPTGTDTVFALKQLYIILENNKTKIVKMEGWHKLQEQAVTQRSNI